MTRRRLPAEERREEVIVAATEIFSRGGYSGSNLREIARAADISLAGLLHHFPTKEALLLAVLDAQDQSRFAANQHPIDEATLEVEITAIVRARVSDLVLLRLWVILDAEATDPEHPAHTRMVERYRGAAESLADRFRTRVEAGQLDASIDPVACAIVIQSFLHGLYARAVLDPSTDVEGVLAEFVRMNPWITGSPIAR